MGREPYAFEWNLGPWAERGSKEHMNASGIWAQWPEIHMNSYVIWAHWLKNQPNSYGFWAKGHENHVN